MSAGIYDATIEQGATFSQPIVVKDSLGVAIDIAGYTARAQIRSSPTSPTVIAYFTLAIVAPSTDGKFSWTMSATETAAIPVSQKTGFQPTQYWYDVEMESAGGIVTRLLQGQVNVIPNVTR